VSPVSILAAAAVVDLAGADPYRLVERDNEDLPVADLAGATALAERLDRRLDEVIGDRDLEANLLRERHLDCRPAIGLDALELTAVPHHAGKRQPAHLRAVQRFEDVIGLLRSDDADDKLHVFRRCTDGYGWSMSAWRRFRPTV
jgi:hypothetical protein